MLNLICLLFGAAIFGYSYLLFRKHRADRSSCKIFGMASFIGLTLFSHSVLQFAAPYFLPLFPGWFLYPLCLGLCGIYGKWLLAPGFGK